MECSQSKTINVVAMPSRAWTNNDRKGLETDHRVEYVSCVEVNGETRTTTVGLRTIQCAVLAYR
jgi:hypothetical protein